MGSALNIIAALLLTVVPCLQPCDCTNFTLFCRCAIPTSDAMARDGNAHPRVDKRSHCAHAGHAETPDRPEHPQPCPKDCSCSKSVAFSAEAATGISTQTSPVCPVISPGLDALGIAPAVAHARPDAMATPPPMRRAFLRLCRILI